VRPYLADDHQRVMEMHLQSPIPSVRALHPAIGLSPELEAVIVRAMQKRPADRFASATLFAEALATVPEARRRPATAPLPQQRAPAARPSAATDPAPPARDARRSDRRRAPLIALLLAVAAAILGLVVLSKAGVF
jgi:serine/threonine-protein kinase